MRDLPVSEIYEKEFRYFPWGTLIERVLDIIEKEAPRNGSVLDLMCGPGYLLGEIAKRRSDLILDGVDISDEFIRHAQCKYSSISFQVADVLSWIPTKRYDLILCTGGIHHLPYNKQISFLEMIPRLLNPNGFAIFADPFVDDFSTELERKLSAAKLGYEYMVATMKNDAPDEIVRTTIDIFYNDVMGFEYKTSLKKLVPIIRKLFSQVEINKTWPEFESEYGEYYILGKL